MKQVHPTNYDIKLVTNFEDFTFEGQLTLELYSENDVSTFTLNAADLNIYNCTLVNGDKRTKLAFTENKNNEELQIDLPKTNKGAFEVYFEYTGKIGDNLKGLYKTQYKVNGDLRFGAVTQFETEDARRCFPCFDEPGMKATFDIELVFDEQFTAISNSPIVSETKIAPNRKSIKFARTPKMSTYLVFIGIADFERIDNKLGDIKVSVITHPGKVQFGKEALEFGKHTLNYCQEYFQIPYPIAKLDLIATPSFAAGAMENWGAILFRENALLQFPGYTSKLGEARIKEVIAHEITHQWFGNLVSPSIWKYIWLNESFATFFGQKIVDHIHPDLLVWERLVNSDTALALLADGYHQTVPIEIKSQKKTSYNIKTIPIIYSKGGAVLRQVEKYLGSDEFRKGLYYFLNKHAYDIASSDDLWSTLETSSGKPISKMMKTWILQPGYPLVTVKRSGKGLTFQQRRFTYIKNSDDSLWMVPLSVIFFDESGNELGREQYLLDNREATYEVNYNYTSFKVNIDHTGLFRVQYEQENLSKLGNLVKNGKLSKLDSWNLQNDAYALFQTGSIDLETYLEFVANYNSASLFLSLTGISNHLVALFNLANEDNKAKLAEFGVQFHEAILGQIQYSPQDQEPLTYTMIRATLLSNAAELGSKIVRDFALQQYHAFKNGNKVSTEILGSILVIAAKELNEFDWFLSKFKSAANEVDIIRFGNAFAEFTEEGLIKKVLEDIVFNKIPPRNRGFIIDRLCQNSKAVGKMWEYFIANLDNFEKMHDSMQMRAINSIVTFAGLDPDVKKDMEQFFENYNNDMAKITVEKSFETLAIKLQVKRTLN